MMRFLLLGMQESSAKRAADGEMPVGSLSLLEESCEPGSGASLADSPLLACNEGVPQHHNDRIPSQEHLGDVAILVDRLRLLLSLPALGHFRPHLLDVLQHHIAVPGGKKTP